jgi:hypothetical protein
MKKGLLLSFLFFSAGFLTHAFFFPDVLSNGIIDVKTMIIPDTTSAGVQMNDPLFTKISFDGTKFSRHNITLRKTNYLRITNTNKTKLMELVGTIKELNTPRGYAESETIQVQFNEKGQYAVADKNNPQEKMIITVK